MLHPGIGNPQVHDVAPNVYAITKLVHFFAHIGVNAGIIQTQDAIIFIDAGMSAYSGEYLWNLAKAKMNGSEDIYLILTHKDTDHCFGMGEICKHGAQIIAHTETARVIENNLDITQNPIANRIRKEYAAEDVLGNAALKKPDRIISDDITLHLGKDVEILSVPGHTPGDIAVYIPESRVLFAGDAILQGMDPYIRPDSISIKDWIDNLDRLRELDIEWIVPGHGEISKPEIIDENIGFLESQQ